MWICTQAVLIEAHADHTLRPSFYLHKRSLEPALGSPAKNLSVVTVQVIRAIGYPQNARVLPYVLEEFTDVNSPALREVMYALDDLEEEIASAYVTGFRRRKGSQVGQRVWKFIQLFDQGVLAPYHLVLDQVQRSYPEAG